MLQHLIASAYIVSALLFVKWWLRKFQSGHISLPEVVAYKRFQVQ